MGGELCDILRLAVAAGQKKYSTAVDLWSCGAIFGEILLRDILILGKTEILQLEKVSPNS